MARRDLNRSEPLLRNSFSVQMPEDTQHQNFITKIKLVRVPRKKQAFTWLLAIFSCGLSFLLLEWNIQLKKRLKFSQCRISEATHVVIRTEIQEIIRPLNEVKIGNSLHLSFVYQNQGYFLQENSFSTFEFGKQLTYSDILDRQSLSESQVCLNREIFGVCQIQIPLKPIFLMALQQFGNPFFLFQIASCILWFWDGYTYYAISILFTTAVSLVLSIYQTRKNMKEIRKISRHSGRISVHRQGKLYEIDSAQLVPGDIIQVQTGEIPGDLVLISGQAVVSQGILTGESSLILKDSISHSYTRLTRLQKRHTLFQGSQIVQIKSNQGQKVLAMVYRTGFQTFKGKLIRSILYPKSNKFKFFQDTMKFILIMALIGILGFLGSLPLQIANDVDFSDIIDRSLDLFTVAIPPALPAAMSVGTAFAIYRLKTRKIQCISPPKVNVAGKIQVQVFDKTGTLTEDEMEYIGCSASIQGKLQKIQKETRNLKLEECLACCHSLAMVDGVLVGDVQDQAIFRGSG